MAFLIAQMLSCLLVAVALGGLVGWLAKDLLAKRERERQEKIWQRQLRSSEARAGTFKNQLAEVKQTEENLRSELRMMQLDAGSAGSGAEDAEDLRAQIARRDKKIDLLELQVKQSEAALTSEWQSLKALKTEIAERQRRLDSRGKQREADWGGKLKTSEEARHKLEQQLAALTQELKKGRSAAARIQKLEAELAERDAKLAERADRIARLTEVLEVTAEEPAAPAEKDDLERLRGIGPVLRAKLEAQGVESFRQIASWSADDVARLGPLVGATPARIRRERWVEQARELLKE